MPPAALSYALAHQRPDKTSASRWLKRLIAPSSSSSSASPTTTSEHIEGSRRGIEKGKGKYIQREPVTLATLNEDVLLEIAQYLDALDLLSINLTCKSLHTFCNLRSLWYQAATRLIAVSIPVGLPAITPNTPTQSLQRAVCRSSQLDHNLVQAAPRPHTRLNISSFRVPRVRFPLPFSRSSSSSSASAAAASSSNALADPAAATFKKHLAFTRKIPFLSKTMNLTLSGDFKMLGKHHVVATAAEGIFLWDLRQKQKEAASGGLFKGESVRKSGMWAGYIPLDRDETVSAFDIDLMENRGTARLALGIANIDGSSTLNIYTINLPFPGSTKPVFEAGLSFPLPSPVKEINISGTTVVGILMSEPPYGALYVCDLRTGGRAVFEPTSIRLPWRVTMVAHFFALSSFDETMHSITVQLIPQADLIRRLRPATSDDEQDELDDEEAGQDGDAAFNNMTAEAETGDTLPAAAAPQQAQAGANPSNRLRPTREPPRHPIPSSTAEFLYPIKGIPSAFASDWLPSPLAFPTSSSSSSSSSSSAPSSTSSPLGGPSEHRRKKFRGTMPILSVSRDNGEYLVDRYQLSVEFDLPPGAAVDDGDVGVDADDEEWRPSASLSPTSHTQSSTREGSSQGCLLSSGTVIWTRNSIPLDSDTEERGGGVPMAMELLLSPVRVADQARNAMPPPPPPPPKDGQQLLPPRLPPLVPLTPLEEPPLPPLPSPLYDTSILPSALYPAPPSSSSSSSTSSSSLKTYNMPPPPLPTSRDMKLPPSLALDKIIGMDVDEATGRLLIGLSNGEIWILEYL